MGTVSKGNSFTKLLTTTNLKQLAPSQGKPVLGFLLFADFLPQRF